MKKGQQTVLIPIRNPCFVLHLPNKICFLQASATLIDTKLFYACKFRSDTSVRALDLKQSHLTNEMMREFLKRQDSKRVNAVE